MIDFSSNRDDLHLLVLENMRRGQRLGQAWFNALHTVMPQWANQIRGTDLDPFYDDNRLPAFLNEIGE